MPQPSASSRPRRAARRRLVLAWLAIVALAAALRLATLDRWPIWIDEAFTLHDAFGVLPSYPLHYLLTRWMVETFGDGALALRALPCACGIATVALLGAHRPQAGAPLQPVSLIAALLLSVSSWHVFWSQSARYYAPITALVLLAFVAATTSPLRPWRVVLVVAAAAAAVLCHPTAAFFLPAMAIVLVLRLPPRPRHVAAIAMAGAAALAVGLYLPLFAKHIAYKGSASTLHFVLSYGFETGPLVLAAAAFGGWPRRGERVSPELVFAGVTLLLFLVASVALFVTGYHAVATLPFVALLAGRGVLRLSGLRRALLLGVLLLEQVVGLVLYHDSNGMRPHWREAAAAMAAARQHGAVLFATRGPPLRYYLRERQDDHDLRTGESVRFLDDWTLPDLEAAAALGPVALIVHPDDLHDWDRSALARLDRLLAQPGTRHRRWPEHFGPKDLSLDFYELR